MFLIFIISTNYDGNSCDDGMIFYKWIQNDFGKTHLSGLKFTIFGLGDNTFEKFNTPACLYFQWFNELHMECLFPMGLGSDHHGNILKDFL